MTGGLKLVEPDQRGWLGRNVQWLLPTVVAVVLGIVAFSNRGGGTDAAVEARVATQVKRHADSLAATFAEERNRWATDRARQDSANAALADSVRASAAETERIRSETFRQFDDARDAALGVNRLGGGAADPKGVSDEMATMRTTYDSLFVEQRRTNDLLREQLALAHRTIARQDTLLAQADSVIAARARQAAVAQQALDAAIKELHEVRRSKTAWQMGSGAAIVASGFIGAWIHKATS